MRTTTKLLTVLGEMSMIERIMSVRRDHLIWFPPMQEQTGTVMNDLSGTDAHGVYSGSPTLAQPGPGGNDYSVLFDGTTDRVDIDVATLDGPFDGAAGSFFLPMRVREASVWTDGVSRVVGEYGADANNRAFFNKDSVNNLFNASYYAGGTVKSVSATSFSPTDWFLPLITWDKAADQMEFFINGAQVGSTQTGLGTWVGALADDFTAIGNFSASGGANFWDGFLAYPALWNVALTEKEAKYLYTGQS